MWYSIYMRLCSVEGCGRKHQAKGYCQSHYMRLWTNGDPATSHPLLDHRPGSESMRFWAQVNKDGPLPENRPDLGPCWLWRGTLNNKGYGAFGFKRKTMRAHRFAYEEEHGSGSAGPELDHLCRTRPCIRPSHLEPVTHAENTRRIPSPLFGAGNTGNHHRAKTHCPKGHPYDETNTRLYKGRRYCRACLNESNHQRSLHQPA